MKLIVRYGKPFVGIVLLCLVLLFGQAMCDLSLPNLMSDMVNVGIQQSGIEEGAPEALRQEGMELLLAFASEEDRQLLEENYYTIEPGSSEAQRLSEEYPMAREEAICVLREDLAGEELPEDSQAGSSAAESALEESGLASSQAGDSAGEEASQQEEPQDAKAALDSAYSRASYAMLLYLQQAGESGELEQAAAQLAQAGVERPTHIFVQAGVGSLAGAVQGYFANLFPDNCPTTVVMEAQAADCLYRSAQAGDGSIRFVTGDMPTIMAGLACGEPNTIGFDILRNHTSFFVSCPDWVSALGMRMLGVPVKGDPQVVSGESGAVGMGLIATLMTNPEYRDLRDQIGLDENSVILMFSTEGDTDPQNYRAIVWGGKQVN